jgi:DNA-binding transcriptional regulator YhcF (GntR family)
MYKIVRSSRLYEQIVQQVEDSIHKGTLKAGDQLPPERELAQQFGVSRTAVREAVKALHEKGLVEAYPGRGTFITDGTSYSMRQSLDRMVKVGQAEGSAFLAEVRAILEPGRSSRKSNHSFLDRFDCGTAPRTTNGNLPGGRRSGARPASPQENSESHRAPRSTRSSRGNEGTLGASARGFAARTERAGSLRRVFRCQLSVFSKRRKKMRWPLVDFKSSRGDAMRRI